MIGLDSLVVRRSGAAVIHDVSLEMGEGRWFGILGANGSGKTSLLRAVAGRLDIVGGRCQLDEVDVTADRHARAAAIGFAPPVESLPAALSVRDVLAILAGSPDEALRALGPLNDVLAIESLLDRRIGACSAGMRQRLSLACAFASGSRVVILDEPFNWLDPVAAFDLREALRGEVQRGLTLVTALHDLTTFTTACDAGALLGAGRVLLDVTGPMLAAAAARPAEFERDAIVRLRESGLRPSGDLD